MKKLVFMFVAIAAISFASCGNNAKPAAEVEPVDTAIVDSAAAIVDSAAAVVDSAAAVVAE